MDIAFHYFAVKSLAVLAGFPDDDAQVIAEYSQMVDDFDFTAYWHCTNIPDYIRNNPDYDLINGIFFDPAQTGFLCDGLLGKTDFINLAIPRFQKFTDTPFHFIYDKRSEIGTANYRVMPALIGDGSVISELLASARTEYRDAVAGDKPSPFGALAERKALMKLGMLLHIFADTVAHQMFSGFNANVNAVKLVNVINNITGADETKKYKSLIIKFLDLLRSWMPIGPKFIPSIGHLMLEHVPDLTHLTFTMEYTERDGTTRYYNRSNTVEFINQSKEILNFLLSCQDQGPIPGSYWSTYSEVLRNAFLTDISETRNEEEMVAKLLPVWNVSRCTYHYSSKELKDSFARETTAFPESLRDDNVPGGLHPSNSTRASDDFYLFNVNAEEVLIALYGSRPRG